MPNDKTAVTYFVPDNPQTARTTRGRLHERVADLTAQVAEGYASDWPDYMKRIGHIAGLREAIAIFDQAEKEE